MNTDDFTLLVDISDFSSDIEFGTYSGCPVGAYAKQLDVVNNETDTQDIVVILPDDSTCRIEVQGLTTRVLYGVKLKGIQTSGTETLTSATAYFDYHGGRKNA